MELEEMHDTVLLCWHEPFGWKLQNLTWRQWGLRAAAFSVVLAIAVCGFKSMPAEDEQVPPSLGHDDWVVAVCFATLAALFVEIQAIRRYVVIHTRGLKSRGSNLLFVRNWNLREIRDVHLEATPGRAHTMTIRSKYGSPYNVGVPKALYSDVAEALNNAGIQVTKQT